MHIREEFSRENLIKGVRLAMSISLGISAALIFFTIDLEALEQIFNYVDYNTIIILLVLTVLNWLAASLTLKILALAVEEKLSIWAGLKVYLAGAFASRVTPFATGGGPFRVYFLTKNGVDVAKASSIVIVQFVYRMMLLGIMSIFFFAFFRGYISSGLIPFYIFILVILFGASISVGIVLFSFVPNVAENIFNKVLHIPVINSIFRRSIRAKRYLVRAKYGMRRFRNSLRVLSDRPLHLILALISAFMFWSLLFFIIPVMLSGMGLEANFMRAYIMQTLIYLVLPFLPTPGASGIAELGVASLFAAFIPGNYVGIVVFGWRFFTFYILLLPGGLLCMREINKGEKIVG